MSDSLSILHLMMEASLVVQLVMVVLLVLAFVAWVWIFVKRKQLKTAIQLSASFEQDFWSKGNLSALYKQYSVSANEEATHHIFTEAFEAYMRLNEGKAKPEALMDGVQRAMRVAWLRHQESLQKGLATLATISSASPYIGLFGTVWGIMNAFLGLSETTQATLQSVAPGIAEALIATAMGLFAAIPAVIAYNRYVDRVETLLQQQSAFSEELYTVLSRESQRV
ncbi:MAG: protein TolQ [Pseudomonadota bacterium]|nr:protein TolQ [Pseudomonadota bacterium]